MKQEQIDALRHQRIPDQGLLIDGQWGVAASGQTLPVVSPIDGQTFRVLTYGSVLFYRRQPGEEWGEAVSRAPEAHDVPLIPQAEALAWSRGGGGLYASGEFSPAPIYYLSPDR